MKHKILAMLIGIAIGAYIGGFLSSETIEYYNYTQNVVSFEPYTEFLNETNVSAARIIVPAVDQDGNGVATILDVQVVRGERRALVNIDNLFFWTDTQNSIRVSRTVAENITGFDLSFYDIIYTITANASIIEGPSAGGAMTVATIAALERKGTNLSVMMTGTMEPDGSIGPVGEITAKAKAAKEIGAELFLVPKGQSVETVYDSREVCENIGWTKICRIERTPKQVNVQEEAGIPVIEASNIRDVLPYFIPDYE